METVQLGLKDAVVQAWRKCIGVTVPIVGRLEVCVEIDAAPSCEITFTLSVKVGSHVYKWSWHINGDRCVNHSVYGPLSVEACVSDWKVEPHSVAFRLQLWVEVNLGIIKKKIEILDQRISFPLPSVEELEALESLSAEELLPTVALLGIEVEELPVGSMSGSAASGGGGGEA
jgi:hypothetical protein